MMAQAGYILLTLSAATLNYLRGEMDAATGYILPPNRIQIPPPPFRGNQLTLNNINVSNSTIGAINTGTIGQLDASITLLESTGQHDIAKGIQELTQALVDHTEVDQSTRNDLAEQLAFLASQLQAKPEKRTKGLIKSAISGISTTLSVSASLMTLWDKLKPLLDKALLGLGG